MPRSKNKRRKGKQKGKRKTETSMLYLYNGPGLKPTKSIRKENYAKNQRRTY